MYWGHCIKMGYIMYTLLFTAISDGWIMPLFLTHGKTHTFILLHHFALDLWRSDLKCVTEKEIKADRATMKPTQNYYVLA